MLFPAAVVNLFRMDAHGFPDAAAILHRTGYDPFTHNVTSSGWSFRLALLAIPFYEPGGKRCASFRGRGTEMRQNFPLKFPAARAIIRR